MKVSIVWLRRDLRIEDNTALHFALNQQFPVLPVFIFDENIIIELSKDDARLNFIHDCLDRLNRKLSSHQSGIKVFKKSILETWKILMKKYDIQSVYANEDYEPYAISRDNEVSNLLKKYDIPFNLYTDHVAFKPGTILKGNGLPYSIYTPFRNKWLKHLDTHPIEILTESNLKNLIQSKFKLPTLKEIGFSPSNIKVKPFSMKTIGDYEMTRDFPAIDGTSYLGPHLRFGTVSIRSIIRSLNSSDSTFLSELIWREFFIQILVFYPRVVDENFKIKYNGILWRNNEYEFDLWCKGKTGYPIVDAGMRQLNETGYMHNRVRMITASFLCKHLLIDWRWGEAYFAEKLLDYELASNNGNWQWVAGTGCDSSPYFRVFNPSTQVLKFDKDLDYVTKWVPDLNELDYRPMVDHKLARERALSAYKLGLESNIN